MGLLTFLCPEAYNRVSTGIDIDPQSFASLQPENILLDCPYCAALHDLTSICAWIKGEPPLTDCGSTGSRPRASKSPSSLNIAATWSL